MAGGPERVRVSRCAADDRRRSLLSLFPMSERRRRMNRRTRRLAALGMEVCGMLRGTFLT